MAAYGKWNREQRKINKKIYTLRYKIKNAEKRLEYLNFEMRMRWIELSKTGHIPLRTKKRLRL